MIIIIITSLINSYNHTLIGVGERICRTLFLQHHLDLSALYRCRCTTALHHYVASLSLHRCVAPLSAQLRCGAASRRCRCTAAALLLLLLLTKDRISSAWEFVVWSEFEFQTMHVQMMTFRACLSVFTCETISNRPWVRALLLKETLAEIE